MINFNTYGCARMTRESNNDILRLVIMMTRVCDDFGDTLNTPCSPKSLKFVQEILYGYQKMFDEGKNTTKTTLGSNKMLKVYLKQCEYDYGLPKLQQTTLIINFKQATLLALVKLKQIIKLRNYQVTYMNSPRAVLYFHSYASNLMIFSLFHHPFEYERKLFELIIGSCISAYEDAHLLDGSVCHVAAIYILMTCKDLHLRNQRLKNVIDKFEAVGKPLDRYQFYIYLEELYNQHSFNKLSKNIRMCEADKNICHQIEEDDMLSLEEFREFPNIVDIVKLLNVFRQSKCPCQEMHKDFYGLVKLFEENVD